MKSILTIAITAVLTWATVGSFATDADVDSEQIQLEAELAELEQEHAALEDWVATELEPWTEDVADAVEEPEPSEGPGAPEPSPSPPIPPLAPLPSTAPSEAPTGVPDPLPTPSPSGEIPSSSCILPIICTETPSVEGGTDAQ